MHWWTQPEHMLLSTKYYSFLSHHNLFYPEFVVIVADQLALFVVAISLFLT